MSGVPGLADPGLRLDAVAAVEPAVRPPGERVEDVVLGVLDVPAVEHDLGRAGRLVAVVDRDEEQVRRRAEPDAAEAELDAGEVHAVVEEDGLLVERAVAVGVFEDDDAVAALAVLASSSGS